MNILGFVAECLWMITFFSAIAYKWLINTNETNQEKFIWIEPMFFRSAIAASICTMVILLYLFILFDFL